MVNVWTGYRSCSIVCALVLFAVSTAAQIVPATIHTPLKYGAGSFNTAIPVDSMRCLVVGDNGRFAFVDLRTAIAQWDSVPQRCVLIDAAVRNDSLVVVDREGRVYVRGWGEQFETLDLPDTTECTSVAFRGHDIVVTTKNGDIWSYNPTRPEAWYREAEFGVQLNAIRSNAHMCVVVGRDGIVAIWREEGASWEVISAKQLRGDHACVLVRQGDFFVGSDSGFVYRIDVATNEVSQIAIQPPFRFNVEAGVERPDRTLSISEAPDGRILCVGNYALASVGCYAMRPDGSGVVKMPYSFALDDISRSPEGRVIHVAAHGDTTRVLTRQGSTNPGFVMTNAGGARWRIDVVRGRFGRVDVVDTDSLICYDEIVTSVDDVGAILRTVRVRRPRSFWRRVDSAARTYVCTQPIDQLDAAHDTLTTLTGMYQPSYTSGDTILMSGDSARIACSTDGGRTWRIGTLPTYPSPGIPFSPRGMIVGTTVALNQANTLFVGTLDDLTFRAVQSAPAGTGQSTYSHFYPMGPDRFGVLRSDYILDSNVARFAEEWFIEGDTIRRVRQYRIPNAHIDDITFYVSNGRMSYVTCLWEMNNSLLVSNLRARLIGSEWVVDTMRLQTGQGDLKNLDAPQTPTLSTAGDTIVATYGNDGVHLCSVDGGLTWQNVVATGSTSRHVSSSMCISKGRIILVGGFSWQASFNIPKITTSVDDRDGSKERDQEAAIHEDGLYDIYDLYGQRLATSIRILPGAQLDLAPRTSAHRVVIATRSTERDQAIVLVLGDDHVVGWR